MQSSPARNPAVREALDLLGITRLALAVHDQCFPSLENEETGRGSPYGGGAVTFMAFAAGLGFNAIQFGPQGATTRNDPSPYMGAVFGKNPLSLSPSALAGEYGGLLTEQAVERALSAHPPCCGGERVDYQACWKNARAVEEALWDRVRQLSGTRLRALADDYARWKGSLTAEVRWLDRYREYEAISEASGTDDWTRWGRADPAGAVEAGREAATGGIDRFGLIQFFLSRQHAALRERAGSLGLLLYGDLQVGLSHRDKWAWRGIFLDGYLLGAPPSRTNPEGQPWGYPVLDPARMSQTGADGAAGPGPALAFFRERILSALRDFDGIRIDHPQGIVCPWVYRSDVADRHQAVREGARLYSSPAFADHPRLASMAIARLDQLNPDPAYPRYGDDWVVALDEEQVMRYSVLLDTVMRCAEECGRTRGDVLCEVLSTWPFPLRACMERYGLGRFCVTQKSDPDNPSDVYRIENTAPADWVMPGNHDTKPLAMVIAERWGSEWVGTRARMLARALAPEPGAADSLYAELTADPGAFREAMFAELFLGPARQVSLFFPDLLGIDAVYNRPGVSSAENWSLRIPRDYERLYRERLARREAFSVPRALARALRARSGRIGPRATELAQTLEQMAPRSA